MKVRFLYHHGKHAPGDEVSVDDAEAETLIRAKRAEAVKAPAKPKATAKKAAAPAKRQAAPSTPAPAGAADAT
jgi:topoisomerase IA-like protein